MYFLAPAPDSVKHDPLLGMLADPLFHHPRDLLWRGGPHAGRQDCIRDNRTHPAHHGKLLLSDLPSALNSFDQALNYDRTSQEAAKLIQDTNTAIQARFP